MLINASNNYEVTNKQNFYGLLDFYNKAQHWKQCIS